MAKAFVKDLATYIRAGYPIVTIVSSEEDRALELVDELLRQKEMWKTRTPRWSRASDRRSCRNVSIVFG